MPNRRECFQSILAASAATLPAPGQQDSALPNVVLLLADDLGYGDAECYNSDSKIPTPHLNRLAQEGLRFTDAHSPSAVCTPTRYGLLTGRYAWRTRLKKGVLDGFDPPLIEPGQTTLASLLAKKGYDTACIGKWHLGMHWRRLDGGTMPQREDDAGFRAGGEVDYAQSFRGGPVDCGFQHFFGISASLDMSPYCYLAQDRPVSIPEVEAPRNIGLLMNQVQGRQSADFRLHEVLPRCTQEAVRYLENSRRQRNPFFLYLPFTAPHLPIVPNADFRGKSQAGDYGDFVFETDQAVGQVLAALDRTGLAKNTLVIFTSDNGGLWHWWDYQETDDRAAGRRSERSSLMHQLGHQSNGKWRGTKADIWEGGHRVPFLVRWPGHVPAGKTSSALIGLNDLVRTIADLTRFPLPSGAAPDSVSFLSALRGTRNPRRSLVLHSLHGHFALRNGPWKYIEKRGSGGFSSPRTVSPQESAVSGQLYHLGKDPAETTNVYKENPRLVRSFQQQLDAVRNQAV